MTLRSSLFVAFRYLLGRGKEGGRYLRGAALGIALSLVPIVVTLVVADGMIQGITDRFLELGTGHIQLFRQSAPGSVASECAMVEEIWGVRGAWPERAGLGILVGTSGKSGANVRAVSPDWLHSPEVMRYLRVLDGEVDISVSGNAVIGQALAEKLSIGVGDRVRLMTTRSGSSSRTIPRLSTFTVKAIVSSGYRELDALWFFIPYQDGLAALSPESSRNFIMVKIDDPYNDAEMTADTLVNLLDGPWFSATWLELQSSQYASYASTRQLLLFIMSLIVIVAAVNVSSSTSMLVVERRRDIAILKSFGAPPRGTSAIFLSGAFMAGLSGTLIGLSAGLLLAIFINEIISGAEWLFNSVSAFFARLAGFEWNAIDFLDPGYYLETIPIIIDWPMILTIGLGTILCSVLAAWAPARQAAKLSPLEILRKF